MVTKFYEFENLSYNPKQGAVNSVRVFSYNGNLSFIPNSDLKYSPTCWMRSFGGQLSDNRTYNLPDKSGTIALISDAVPYSNVLALISLKI